VVSQNVSYGAIGDFTFTTLAGTMKAAMRTPEIEKRVLSDGYMLVANTPAQFKSEIQAEVATWSRVIRERGIKGQ